MTRHTPAKADPKGEPPPETTLFVHPKRLSQVLVEAAAHPGERISVRDLTSYLAARGFAPLVLLMAMLNVVTIIPGSSTVMGMPLVFMGIALTLNARRMWLPQWLARKSFDRAALQRTVTRALPYLDRIERLAKPRFWPRGGWVLDRAYGIIVLVFALMITLPVPFGNTAPALAIILLSMGFAARDGLWVAAGLMMGATALGIVVGIAGAISVAGASIFGG